MMTAQTDNFGARPSPNGHQTAHSRSRPLRFAFFGESIISDWHNPAATTVRAVMRALTAAGHEATFFEQRKNRATIELLHERGSAPLRAFAARYPDLHYRTYDLPTGLERTVWFVRQAATVDAIILLDGVPAGIVEEAARLDAHHLTRITWSAKPNAADAPWAEIRLSPARTGVAPGTIICGPAVEPSAVGTDGARAGVLLVAYDDLAVAESARAALDHLAPVCLSAGSVGGEAWPFVSEVDLPERYRRARLAVVTGFGNDPFAAARTLLPLAYGCPTIACSGGSSDLESAGLTPIATVSELMARARRRLAAADLPAPAIPDRFAAATCARTLVDAVRRSRAARLV
jgi:hypothetical protein